MSEQVHTILIVDDEPANLRMMERLLRRDYRVITASSGPEALEILKHETVAVIISDERMPGMTGTELLRQCRLINADLMRMIITANTDMETSMNAMKQGGALRVIHKPWDPDQVLLLVKEALAKHESLLDTRRVLGQLENSITQMKRSTHEMVELTKQG